MPKPKKTKTAKGNDMFDKPKSAQEQKLENVQNLYNYLFKACKYKIKDNDVFEKAYQYIEMYY